MYCIWRLRFLIRRQSRTGYFYCKGGRTIQFLPIQNKNSKNQWKNPQQRRQRNRWHSRLFGTKYRHKTLLHQKYISTSKRSPPGINDSSGEKGWRFWRVPTQKKFSIFEVFVPRKRNHYKSYFFFPQKRVFYVCFSPETKLKSINLLRPKRTVFFVTVKTTISTIGAQL